MARTNKQFDGKRTQLLRQIWNIFLIHGYQDTTLSLIMKELGISKGVFYHYFDSKEHCAQAAVDSYSILCVDKLKEEYEKTHFAEKDAIEQFKLLMTLGGEILQSNAGQLKGIDSPANQVFHQMLLVSLTKKLTPFYTAVIQKGVDSGCFHTDFPQETAEMLLTLSNFYLDQNLFNWERNEISQKVKACQGLIAKALGTDSEILFC